MLVAVIEPLEVVVRPQFGRAGRIQMLIAVIEPLEVVVGARFGQAGNKSLKSMN